MKKKKKTQEMKKYYAAQSNKENPLFETVHGRENWTETVTYGRVADSLSRYRLTI